jgi:glycosyltransferase involved in cell wall biosynthesis
MLSAGAHAAMTWLGGLRPYAVYATGSDVLLRRGLSKRFSSRILKDASLVLANGRYLAAATSSLSGRMDVRPLYIGVDTAVYTPPKCRGKAVRILAPRGFLPLYNQDYLITAIGQLSEGVTFDGLEFPSSGPTLEATKRLADSTLSGKRRQAVVFHGGVSSQAMRQLLEECCIFVSLARTDGTAISLLEALACGLYPIVSDIPQNREWISPALGNGTLVPLDNSHAVAEAIAEAITDPMRRARAAETNRELVVARGDMRTNMATLADYLTRAAEAHAGWTKKWQ